MIKFHGQDKWVIGLTGSMLSGKSTALACFARYGTQTISCDEIVQQLYTSPRVLTQLKRVLGTADKTQIAQRVFTDPHARKRLEQVLHPLVLKEVCARIKQSKQSVIVVEIPLLFESGWDKLTDLNIVVLADPKTLPARLKGRKMTRAEYMRRTRHQLPDEVKAQRADVVFYHATKAQLTQSVIRFGRAMNLLHV
ncbi:MAG: dephospho-CoA kinase [Elusimicrobiaceae bacterium]|nr:dephospho-CoA kinase [Elusimicrobiaceae bacterium]